MSQIYTKEDIQEIIAKAEAVQKLRDKGKWKKTFVDYIIGVPAFLLSLALLFICLKAIGSNLNFFIIVWFYVPFFSYWLRKRSDSGDMSQQEFNAFRYAAFILQSLISVALLFKIEGYYDAIEERYRLFEWYWKFLQVPATIVIVVIIIALPMFLWTYLMASPPHKEA